MTAVGFDAASGTVERPVPFTSGLVSSELATGRAIAAGRSLRALRADALAMAAAIAVASLMAESSGGVVWLTAGYVAVMLLIGFAAVLPFERCRSARPTMQMIAFGGAALLLLQAFDVVRPIEARGSLLVIAVAATVRMLAVGVESMRRSQRSVLLVGGRVEAGAFVGQWAGGNDIEIKAICLTEYVDESAPEMLGIPVMGSLDDVPWVATNLAVDEVVVVPGPTISADDVRRLSWSLEQESIELLVAAELDGAAPHRIRPVVRGQRLLFSVRPARPSAVIRLFKAIVDWIGAGVLIVLFTPVFVIVAALVRWDSPGAAIFRQTRIGRDGGPFTMLKFRTMVTGAEAMLPELMSANEGSGPLFKLNNDPRTTTVGRWLRRSSLDELPQLFNVLSGHMSLIGPRPALPGECRQYDDWVRRRLKVKPGMTGEWQVSGRSNLSWSESVRFDLDYVDNYTIRRDLSIALRTAHAVIGRDGAV